MAPLIPPGALFAPSPQFSLDSSGVAGFFGGEEAISAMATVHLYKGRRWLGWYNSPGSYTIAKHFGRMARSRFWDGLFPGPNDPPAISFELDGKKGPRYIAALSGTTMDTCHLAYLTMERTRDSEQVEVIEGRETKSIDVAYLAMNHVDYGTSVERLPFKKALLALIPITVSVVTCVMCALVYDWYSFSMILIGIISSGWASIVIGKGRLDIKFVNPAKGSPPGHGILMADDIVVVVKGEERDVNAITKGHFVLETDSKQGVERNEQGMEGRKGGGQEKKQGTERGKLSEKGMASTPKYHEIGICSLVLLAQFLAQLLLVPQGTLFGQIMFLVSLGVSWGYNSYLSSLEKEKIQAEILFKKLGNPVVLRFRAGTRTTMAVFVCLLALHGVDTSSLQADRRADDKAGGKVCNYALRGKILDHCIPNDTPVWKRWRERVIEQLLNISDESESLSHLKENEESKGLSKSDNELFKQLLQDAGSAFRWYFKVRKGLPGDSSHKPEQVEG